MIRLPIGPRFAKVGPEGAQNQWKSDICVFSLFFLRRWLFTRPQYYWQFTSRKMSFGVQIGLKTLEGLKKWKSVNAIAATVTFWWFVRWSQLIIEISYFFINLHLRVHESDHSGPTSDPNLHHEAAATETFQNWAFAGAVVGASFFIFYTLSVLSIFPKQVFWSNVLRPSFWFCRWSPAGSSIHPP